MTGLGRWWQRRSLRARLTSAAAAVIAVGLTVSAVVLTLWLRSSLLDTAEELAWDRADAVADVVTERRPESLVLAAAEDEIVEVVTTDGALVATSVVPPPADSLLALSPTSGAVRTQRGVALAGEGDEPFRVVTRSVTAADGENLLVQVAVPLDDAEETIEQLVAALLVGVPVLVVALGALSWLLAGRALHPVESLREQAAAIPGTALDRRLEVPDSDDELARLARTFNALLGRVEVAAQRQRRFLADAAHEIRNPVASLRAQLEVAQHTREARGDELLSQQVDEVQRLSVLVDDLLRLARLDADVPLRQHPVDLDEVVLDRVRRLRGSTALAVDSSAVKAAQVMGDADALGRVVQNILDNARRYASRSIIVTLEAIDTAVLTVADDGPGVPPERRHEVFERFTRLDEARTRQAGGTGLGLAIVREVVISHGGSVMVEDANPGARFVVTLPLLP